MKNTELSNLVDLLYNSIDDPMKGLPDDIFYFISQITPLINVDLLIKNNKNQTLLTWRDDKFYGPGWHVPGGIIRFKEDFHTRIKIVSKNELGCDIKYNIEPLKVSNLINKKRNLRGHFISLLFYCELLNPPDPNKEFISNSPKNGQWYWFNKSPANLLLQHNIYRDLIDEKN